MNNIQSEILLSLNGNQNITQRELAKKIGISLGIINQELHFLRVNNYLTDRYEISRRTIKLMKDNSPKKAVILAAGYGQRSVPINLNVPKGLIKVRGEILIEKLIKQLKEAGISDIGIVVGYKKEAYEYLIDLYDVRLIVNTEYSKKNNLFSLSLAGSLSNSYIIPCDVMLSENPFSNEEINSWYLVGSNFQNESQIKATKRKEINIIKHKGNKPVGVAYLNQEDGNKLTKLIKEARNMEEYNDSFWEDLLMEGEKYWIGSKIIGEDKFIEINTYEDLRKADNSSEHLENKIMNVISTALNIDAQEIKEIQIIKKGMTNRSFSFVVFGKKYIMRIPGEGTGELINRLNEASVYDRINGRDICDNVIYFDRLTGYKITEYLENSRTCDPYNEEDLIMCMDKLKNFHGLKIKGLHKFDIFGEIIHYEKLREKKSIFKDYANTKDNLFSTKDWIEKNKKENCLSHIDAIPDNFLIQNNGEVRLIDWEYAGMQDPDLDLAMFAIYSGYTKKDVDHLLEIYYKNKYDNLTKTKIYLYMALAGLLWSNWCEYKGTLGIDFGQYSLDQYRYAKDFYTLAKKEGLF